MAGTKDLTIDEMNEFCDASGSDDPRFLLQQEPTTGFLYIKDMQCIGGAEEFAWAKHRDGGELIWTNYKQLITKIKTLPSYFTLAPTKYLLQEGDFSEDEIDKAIELIGEE